MAGTLALLAVNVAAYVFLRWRLDRDHERRLADAIKAEHSRFLHAITSALNDVRADAARCRGQAPAACRKEMN